jgi:DNA (cytosine-5)-methyltransferase 1
MDKFCQKVLSKHWPGVPCIKDVNNVEAITNATTTGLQELQRDKRSNSPDETQGRARMDHGLERPDSLILTAGFPCQPFSNAGRKRGSSDDRYLWPQTLAVIEAVRPDWILLENVPGILNMVFTDSQSPVASQASFCEVPNDDIADYDTISGRIDRDLRQAGYETVWLVIPACSLGAPHRRDRVWIVANRTDNLGQSGLPRQEQWGMADEDKQTIGRPDVNDPAGWGRRVLHTENIRQGNGQANASINTDSCAADTGSEGLQVRPGKYDRRGTLRKERETISQVNTIPGWSENWYAVAQRFCVLDDGVSDRLARYGADHERLRNIERVQKLKALGNAIVPQVAYQIIKAIKEADEKS